MDLSTLSTAVNVTGTLLIHSVWQGVAVGLLYALTMLALGGASPRARYNAALFWLTTFALAPVITAVWLLPGGAPGQALTSLISRSGGQASPGFDVLGLAPVLTSLWLAGVAVLALRLLWNWRRTERLTHLGCHALPAYWIVRLTELADQMGVRRNVSIVESVLVPVPTVIGWLKPVILIPSSALLGLSRRQLELIIAHELAHIRRYDYVVNYFLLLMETLFFYHPVVYLIGRGLRHERELCCDDLVVVRCGGRVEYVTALTDLETLRSAHVLTEPLSNLAATGGDLLHRVQRIVRGRAPVVRRMYVVTVATALTLLLGAVALLDRGVAESGPTSATVARAEPLPVSPPRSEVLPEIAPRAQAMLSPASFLPAEFDVPALSRTQPRREVVAAETPSLARRAVPDPEPQVKRQPLVKAIAPPALKMDAHVGLPAGPTHAMKTELHLASPVLDTVSDLQRDASQALKVSTSPYVIIFSEDTESDYVVSDLVHEEGGALIKRIEPRYPSRARLRGYEDTVQIEFRVTGGGHVEDIVVVSESRSTFERAVIRAVKKWRYEPLLRDGVPTERTMVETFAFQRSTASRPVRGVGCRRDKSNNTFSCSSPGFSRVL